MGPSGAGGSAKVERRPRRLSGFEPEPDVLASLRATGRVQIQPGRFPTHGEPSTRSLSLAVLGVLFVGEDALGVFRNLNPDETRFARLV